ncbi:hypothetical protein FO519_009433 [Halicephalobus sp. NKZ332]|nr:hypothetical protein FO519_009433 [Halicephalobus sp. NKZ332]
MAPFHSETGPLHEIQNSLPVLPDVLAEEDGVLRDPRDILVGLRDVVQDVEIPIDDGFDLDENQDLSFSEDMEVLPGCSNDYDQNEDLPEIQGNSENEDTGNWSPEHEFLALQNIENDIFLGIFSDHPMISEFMEEVGNITRPLNVVFFKGSEIVGFFSASR